MREATREDVICCYRNILGREPENEETVSRLIGWDFWALVHRFSHSDEHRTRIGRSSPHSLLKCLNANYLARDLPVATRASAVIDNYATLRDRLTPAHLVMLLERGLPLIAGLPACPELTIDVSLFDGPVDEGEISLIASFAGRRLAVLTFTIVAGEAFALPEERALLVSRVQGYRGAGPDVRRVTLAMGVAPPLLLVAALEGIAGAFGIRSILCVSAATHPYAEAREDILVRAYDELFARLGAQRTPTGFLHLRLPRAERPLDQVPAEHRARSRRRRAMRRATAAAAQARWLGYLAERGPVALPGRVAATPKPPLKTAHRWLAELAQGLRTMSRGREPLNRAA